jgi:hypothetical protein
MNVSSGYSLGALARPGRVYIGEVGVPENSSGEKEVERIIPQVCAWVGR